MIERLREAYRALDGVERDMRDLLERQQDGSFLASIEYGLPFVLVCVRCAKNTLGALGKRVAKGASVGETEDGPRDAEGETA